MRTRFLLLALLSSLAAACGDRDSTSGGPGATFSPPTGRPEELPKVAARADAIVAMLHERFGDDVARNVVVGVEDAGGVRVQLRGEVPNAAIRDAMMKEVAVRVTGLQIQDFNLDVAGPIRMVWSFDVNGESGWVVFSPDLSLAVTEEGDLYEMATGRRINRLALDGLPKMETAVFSPDGKTLATGHQRGGILRWKMPLGDRYDVLRPESPDKLSSAIVALDFTADGKALASLDHAHGEVFLWDLAHGGGRMIGGLLPTGAPHDIAGPYLLAIAPDGKTIAAASSDDRGVSLWDVASGTRSGTLAMELFYPSGIAWSRNGRFLAVARAGSPTSGTVVVYEMPGRKARTFSVEAGTDIDAIALSDDGALLATRASDQPLRLWDVGTGRVWLEIPNDKVGPGRGLRFSPDASLLATQCGTRPPSLRLWDLSARPGGSGRRPGLPPAYRETLSHDDALARAIEGAIRHTFDRRNIESLQVEVGPDGSVHLSGRVSDREVKDVAGRTAADFWMPSDPRRDSPRRVVNDLEVTGRLGK